MDGSSPKIKVCHLAMADLWAGAEVQLAILLRGLAQLPDLEVSAILFNDGRLANELRGAGITTQVIPETKCTALSIVKQLRHYLAGNTIDVLHTHKYKDNILGAVASTGARIPHHVRTIHGSLEPFTGLATLKMNLYQAMDSAINRWRVDRILVVSFALWDWLVVDFGAEKVICVHNGVDIDEVRPARNSLDLRAELGLAPQHFVIGTMGRLTPVKGLEVFLSAARVIREHAGRAKFVIAGDGPLRPSLEALAHQYQLDNDIIFLGHRDDSHDILALMDLFVLPSLSEGIPLVLLEAMALGRPVIATRVGGIPEVVEHGINGLLVTTGRVDEIAQNCLTLMDDPPLARRLGAAGRRRVEEAFSARSMAESVANVYRKLVGNGEN